MAMPGLSPVTRKTFCSSALPLTLTGGRAMASTRSRTDWKVPSLMIVSPGLARPTRREATFMASPMAVYCSALLEPMAPKITGPVLMPTPMRIGGMFSEARVRLNSLSTCIISSAQATALNGESSMKMGAPNRPMISSPTNLSRVPWYLNSTSTMTSKYSLSVLTTSFGGRPSDMAVKPRMSE